MFINPSITRGKFNNSSVLYGELTVQCVLSNEDNGTLTVQCVLSTEDNGALTVSVCYLTKIAGH